MPDIRPIKVTGPPGGIYQGPNPPPNTVQDMCNIDTSRGMWSVRPGAHQFIALTLPNIVGMCEYRADGRYATHDFYDDDPVSVGSVVLAISAHPSLSSSKLNEIANPKSRTTYDLPASQVNADYSVYASAQMLHRTYHSGLGVATYAPVMVFSNGIDPPFYYSQRPSGVSVLDDLDSMTGDEAGLSTISSLPDVPHGKVMAVFNGVLFMANFTDGGNRIQWCGFDSAGVPVCNFWPSQNFLNIGIAGDTVTAMVPFKDVMLVFTENKVYALSGTGTDSLFRLDEVFKDNGSLPMCAVNVGDSVLFMGPSGVYRTNGSSTVNISHPALSDVWGKITTGGQFLSALYDPQRHQVYFSSRVSPYSDSVGPYSDVVLVYDLKYSAWSRWGSWSGTAGEDPDNYLSMRMGVVSTELFGRPKLLFASYNRIHSLEDHCSYDQPGASKSVMYWFIKTHRYFEDSDDDKLLRYVQVTAQKSGDWDLHVAVLTDDDDTLVDAIKRKVGDKWTFLIDAVASVDHHVAPVTGNFRSTVDGPVDIYDVRSMRKLADSVALGSSSPGEVTFTASYTSKGKSIELLVPEDTADINVASMAAQSMFAATASVSYARKFATPSTNANTNVAYFEKPRTEEMDFGVNVTAKHFGLWMSGDTIKTDIKGWGLWLRPLRTKRPK